MDFIEKNRTPIILLFISAMFVLGVTVGYFVIPRNVRVQVIKESGDYVRYKEVMEGTLYPFNETDIVTATMIGSTLKINHTVDGGEYNLKFYELGVDENGFWRYITQWKELQ